MSIDVTLRLKDDESLPELLKGIPVYAVLLHELEPGVYGLSAAAPGAAEEDDWREWVKANVLTKGAGDAGMTADGTSYPDGAGA